MDTPRDVKPADPSLCTYDGPMPEVVRDAEGNPAPFESFPSLDWDAENKPPPSCGLCGRLGPLATGRSICANCAFFPLD